MALASPIAYGQEGPRRLSDWILEQPPSPAPYLLGLSWRVPEEVPAQGALRLELLNSLAGADRSVRAEPQSMRRLHDWLQSLPVTGRAPVAVADARWLQANPARDPLLLPGHSIVLPQRPSTVTVVTVQGARCVALHLPGREARAYLEACDAAAAGRADWAWIAQPDGRVQRFGIAAWNREAQDEPAPGAWIWGPARDSGWPEEFSNKLARFLATQGPAPDHDPSPRSTPGSSKPGVALDPGFRRDDAMHEQSATGRQHSGLSTELEPRTTNHEPRATTPGGAAEGFRFSHLTGLDRRLPPEGWGKQEASSPRPRIESGASVPSPGSSASGVSLDPRLRGDDVGRGDDVRRGNDAMHEPRATSYEPRTTSDEPRSTNHEPRTTVGERGKRSRGLELTASDWGNVGLLQTPTARMHDAGHFTFNYSRTQPYSHGNIFVQPFDWMEAGFRYTDISNRLYGELELSGGQSRKDKGFDVKFRLWPESAYVPQVAVGFRDIAGTGLFSGEYLVASKRTGDFDWSLGVGWGYLAGESRSLDTGQGGNFNFGSYFRAAARPFGGVQWQTPWDKLIAKLEYDGNDYQSEPLANNQRQSSPLNFGLVYRWGRATDVTLGFERGNQISLGLTLHTQLDGLTTPKAGDPPRVPVAAAYPQQQPDWTATARDILLQADWSVQSIEQRGREVRVTLDEADAIYWRERLDRVAAVLHRDAPATVDRFVLAYPRRGTPLAEHVVDRRTWVTQQIQPVTAAARRDPVVARAAEPAAPAEAAEPGTTVYSGAARGFDHGLSLGYAQTLGGPDAFLLYQFYAEERARWRLRDDTWLSGALRLRLLDNYDKFTFTGPSNLPRVRTFLREYLTSSSLTMPNLQLSHFGKAGANQYYSVYGGYLEEMFAGVGSEWLYRPFASRLAFGVDVNAVKQREFEQAFGFRDYSTGTGHGTLYWDTGWQDVVAKLSAGRYLAGDSGVTVDLSRVFPNGVVLGAFATKTNVSAEQFGEGSFDKGVYLAIPFDAMLARTTNSTATFLWRPLTRDGGAKLLRSAPLYDVTRPRSDRTLKTGPAPAPNDTAIPADRREARTPEARGPEPYTRVTARPSGQQWRSDASHEYRLIEALQAQEFRNIGVTYDTSNRLTLALANDRLHPIGRAVGRAARTALRLAPEDAREIHIVFAERTDPVARYEFFDLRRLGRYFGGEIGQAELAQYVKVEYLNPAAREADPLARLDDVDTSLPGLTALLPETRGVGRVMDDFGAAAGAAWEVNWLRAGAIGAGVVLSSALLDDRIDRFAKDHVGGRLQKNLTRVGDAIPWLALAGSAVAAFDGSDPARSRAGYAAAEAGATALLVSTGLKYAVGRARPNAGLGSSTFEPLDGEDRYQAFPSRHTTIAWAVATPFALEYNAPWLYGIAALTNLGRTAGREHWFSDTVAGSVLGYGLGRIFWESARAPGKGRPQVMLHSRGVVVASEW